MDKAVIDQAVAASRRKDRQDAALRAYALFLRRGTNRAARRSGNALKHVQRYGEALRDYFTAKQLAAIQAKATTP